MRHLLEDSYAQSKIGILCDDKAIVTSDYKMKILSCFSREAQKKWFGKQRTNLRGFMITTNALNKADKLQGVKDVQFVFMVTDNCLTDACEVVRRFSFRSCDESKVLVRWSWLLQKQNPPCLSTLLEALDGC
jgi:hypothetical protein